MNQQALWAWSALEIRDAVRCKAISATAVVTAHLDRINAINPQINAIGSIVFITSMTLVVLAQLILMRKTINQTTTGI